MIFVVATAFWLLTCVLVIRLIRIDRDTERQSRWGTVARVVLLAACVPLFFRPHDLVLSGQDSGVYLNSAAAFARHGSLFHTDPLLKEVPDASRKAFYFGHYKGYGITKDGCLKLKDRKTALVGPRFPPLYPIAMSLLIRIFGPRSAHYVVPLFAVPTVFALGVLGGRLFRKHAAGTLRMLFYGLTPVVIWHGRIGRFAVETGLWSWEVLPLPPVEASSGCEWYTLRAEPSWDPELDHYPTDLAARLGCIAIIEHP